MGHYLSELYPRGYDVEMQEERQREREREKAREARYSSRLKQEWQWMRISGEELSQDVLKKRISAMSARLYLLTSVIPASITLHLKDDKDDWDISGNLFDNGDALLIFERRKYDEDERFDFSIRKGEARATHSERGLFDISIGSKNSEREIRPGEELFDKLISPLEEKMGLLGK